MKKIFAVAFAVGAALCLNCAMYLQKKAVDTLPAVELRLSFSVVKAFFIATVILSRRAEEAGPTAAVGEMPGPVP